MEGNGPEEKKPSGKIVTGKPSSLAKQRKLASWVDAFFDLTSAQPSPAIFRRWAAISTVAGALERKVWVHTYQNLYPNLYTILVGPPGVGKTLVTKLVQDFWSELPDHHIAPSAVSRASLMDSLREAERKIVLPQQTPPVVTFNTLLIAANELGVLIPGYDNEFMNTLTDVYDGHRYAESKRSKDLKYVLASPQLNLIAATTPSYLNNVMPEGAWDQGFISRVLLIYSGESSVSELFADTTLLRLPRQELVHDLKIISNLYGKMLFTEESAGAISAWHKAKGPPAPEHPKLLHYNTRRTAHLLKLCMVASAASSNDLIITLEHYNTALSWLLEAESFMPDIFKSMAVGGDARAIEDTWYYAYQIYAKEKKSVSEPRLIEFLQNRVPAHSVERIITVMVKSGLLEKRVEGFIPRAKRVS